jgi:inosine-uridine nucleoside N-ribohydrolase
VLSVLTDPVLGSWRRDVDDVMAIIMLKEYLKRLATTEGNGPPQMTYRTALLLKKKLGLKASIHPSPKLGHTTTIPSDKALYMSIREGQDIITIAPNTYLSRALTMIEKTPRSILTVMGGAIRKRLLYILPEFNFWKDPQAAKHVIENHVWKTRLIVPIDTTITVKWNCKLLSRKLRDKGHIWLVQGIKPWCFTSKILFGGFIPHDLIAAYLYKCWIKPKDCTGELKVKETKLLVKGTRLVKDANGVDAFVLHPSKSLSEQVLENLLESLI